MDAFEITNPECENFVRGGYFSKKHRFARENLPYGKWICQSGREVLFNRRYKPIWQRVDGITSPADQDERVEDIAEENWLYDDGNPPWRQVATLRSCLDTLKNFGAASPLQRRNDKLVW